MPLNNTSDLYKEMFSTGLMRFHSFKASYSPLMLITKVTAFSLHEQLLCTRLQTQGNVES